MVNSLWLANIAVLFRPFRQAAAIEELLTEFGRLSALFGVPHVLFQQYSASSICDYKVAEIIRRHAAEPAKLICRLHRNGWRIPFRVCSCLQPAQPVEVFCIQAWIHGVRPLQTPET